MANSNSIFDIFGQYGENDLNAAELRAVEKKRRQALKTTTSMKPCRSLFHLEGSGFLVTVSDPLFILTMVTYIVFRCIYHLAPQDVSDAIRANLPDPEDLKPISFFLTFFQSIMFAQSYKRFFSQYMMSMSCEGRIFDLASLASASLEKNRARKIVRYMNAAHASGYVGMTPTYSYANFFQDLNRDFQLLTYQECQRMREMNMNAGGSCYRELIAWTIREVQDASKKGLIDAQLAFEMREKILKLRGALGGLYDFDDQPLPYYFGYFVFLLSLFYLPLFAITIGDDENVAESGIVLEIITFFSKATNAFFIVGLRVLSHKMAKPYKDAVENLSVMHYVNFTCRASFRILSSQAPSDLDHDEEEKLAVGRSAVLGDPWTWNTSYLFGDPEAVSQAENAKIDPELFAAIKHA